ncbi:hypothetical protein ACFW1A_04815 [Kitasatospora sp. NPDC058965]|uniref:hypothetical protein n=1 Tax=Kitasatospora sp. NPDC058965 TaxID=3346682 RepID=UPI00369DD7B0
MNSFWNRQRRQGVARQPNSLLGRWLAAMLANHTELSSQYSDRSDEIPHAREQALLVQEVFEDLLGRYLGLGGTSGSGLLDDTGRIFPAPHGPSRSGCERVITAARRGTPEAVGMTFVEALVVQTCLCKAMLPRLAWTEAQVIDLICEKERRIEERGIALHPAEGPVRVRPARLSMTQSQEYRAAVEAVFEAGTEKEVSDALARCNSYFPVASLLFFRTAIRWKFPVPCDPQEVARVVSGYLHGQPADSRYLFDPRAAEAAILVELNGDTSLASGIPVDEETARMGMQLVTKNVFAETVGIPQSVAQLRSIAEHVVGRHREIAELSDLRLDRLFASRPFDPAEVELEVARITGGTTAGLAGE